MPKKKPTYFPLRLIYNYDEKCTSLGNGTEWRYSRKRDEMSEACGRQLPVNPEVFLKDISDAHIEIRKNRKIPESDAYQYKLMEKTLEQMAASGYDIKNSKTLIADAMDMVMFPFVLDVWAHNKQAYKPDEYFVKALLNTKNFTLTRQEIEHLPTNTFFIDLSDVKYTKPYEGAFVNIIPDKGQRVFINVFLMMAEIGKHKKQKGDSVQYSHYFMAEYDDDGTISEFINKLLKEKDAIESTAKANPMQAQTVINISDDGDIIYDDCPNYAKSARFSRMDMVVFVLQLLCYLSSVEPDIEESPITRKIYRKPVGEPKDRFSEVQQHDVGVRYGDSIRALLGKQEEEGKKHRGRRKDGKADAADMKAEKAQKDRKRPIPHFRKAHWQRYWVGEGRKQQVTKWIKPIFVGFGKRDENISNGTDVVIHRVY